MRATRAHSFSSPLAVELIDPDDVLDLDRVVRDAGIPELGVGDVEEVLTRGLLVVGPVAVCGEREPVLGLDGALGGVK
jgi:hypothetical protein